MFTDLLTFDKPRLTRDGYMAVRAKAARTGVYEYDGAEIDPDDEHGLRDAGRVNVLRDEKTVFDQASARSFIGKPVTDDHPADPITADNWRDHARGMVMGAMRDGDYLAFDLLLTDSAAIKQIGSGKRALSNGYSADLEFGEFSAPDGTECVARQSKIIGNHVALVDKGRAGPQCRIADAATCEPATFEIARPLLDKLFDSDETYSGNLNSNKTANSRRKQTMHTLTIDGLQVAEVSDQAKAAIEKLQGQHADAVKRADKAEADLAKVTTDRAELEAKAATLEAQLKDSALTPQQLRDAAKAFAKTVEAAKALAPKVTISDDMDEAAIRRAVVGARIGDTAQGWTDEQVAVSFDTLAAAASDADPVRQAIAGGLGSRSGDVEAAATDAWKAATDDLNAWRKQA